MANETQQGFPMIVEPRREHEWLRQLIGDWTWEGECNMGPDQRPWKSTGTEQFRALGDLWFIGEGESGMPDGGKARNMMTLGFDPQKQQFVGAFVTSCMDHLWVYQRGELDAARGTLSLYAEGPNISPNANGSTAFYRDVIEIKSNDHRTMTSAMLNDDGTWSPFMQAHYHRRK